MSDYLPITPERDRRASIAAAEAGAAIIHLHARDPETGAPTPDPAVFMQFLPVIKQTTDAVINITTGGGLSMTLDERLAAPLQAKPEMCSLNMGWMNFDISRSAATASRTGSTSGRSRIWKAPTDFIFRNTFTDIEQHRRDAWARATARASSSSATTSATSTTWRTASTGRSSSRRCSSRPSSASWAASAPSPRNLLFMKETADRLFGDDYVWSVLAAGRHQMAFTTMAGILGGNVRVGLEDSLYIGKGVLAKSNAEQVAEDPPHPGGAQPGDRHAEGGAGDAEAEGRRPRRVLVHGLSLRAQLSNLGGARPEIASLRSQ